MMIWGLPLFNIWKHSYVSSLEDVLSAEHAPPPPAEIRETSKKNPPTEFRTIVRTLHRKNLPIYLAIYVPCVSTSMCLSI